MGMGRWWLPRAGARAVVGGGWAGWAVSGSERRRRRCRGSIGAKTRQWERETCGTCGGDIRGEDGRFPLWSVVRSKCEHTTKRDSVITPPGAVTISTVVVLVGSVGHLATIVAASRHLRRLHRAHARVAANARLHSTRMPWL